LTHTQKKATSLFHEWALPIKGNCSFAAIGTGALGADIRQVKCFLLKKQIFTQCIIILFLWGGWYSLIF